MSLTVNRGSQCDHCHFESSERAAYFKKRCRILRRCVARAERGITICSAPVACAFEDGVTRASLAASVAHRMKSQRVVHDVWDGGRRFVRQWMRVAGGVARLCGRVDLNETTQRCFLCAGG